MNKVKRDKLNKAIELILSAKNIVDYVIFDEENCIENYPENLQNSDTFINMENSLDLLNCAMDTLDESIDNINNAL